MNWQPFRRETIWRDATVSTLGLVTMAKADNHDWPSTLLVAAVAWCFVALLGWWMVWTESMKEKVVAWLTKHFA